MHDVIITVNPYTVKFVFAAVGEKNNNNKSDVERYTEYVHLLVVFQDYLTRLGE